MCGEPVLKRRRRHCETCMPKARREHGLRAIEAARTALAAQTAAGDDPRRSAAVNRARGDAISEGHQRNRRWAREHPGRTRCGLVQARGRAEARCVLAQADREGYGIIARSVLTHPGGGGGAASQALGGVARACPTIAGAWQNTSKAGPCCESCGLSRYCGADGRFRAMPVISGPYTLQWTDFIRPRNKRARSGIRSLGT